MPDFFKLFDDKGNLKKLTDAIQPELDLIESIMQSREFYASITSELNADNLLFLQQLIGFANIGEHYLGVGCKSEWDIDTQRDVLLQGWEYLKAKGTEVGIRQAITMWLRWQPDNQSQLQIYYPFGNKPISTPPSWWGWSTPYDYNVNRSHLTCKFFGGSYLPGSTYSATEIVLNCQYFLSWRSLWHGQSLKARSIAKRRLSQSRLGPFEAWMVIEPPIEIWNQVFNDIRLLNPEIWAGLSRQSIFQKYRWDIVLPEDWVYQTVNTTEEIVVTEFTPLGWQWHHTFSLPAPRTEKDIIYQIAEGVILGWQWGYPFNGGFSSKKTQEALVTTYQYYPGFQWDNIWYGVISTVVQQASLETRIQYKSSGQQWDSLWRGLWGDEEVTPTLIEVENIISTTSVVQWGRLIPWHTPFTEVYSTSFLDSIFYTPTLPWYAQYSEQFEQVIETTEQACSPGKEALVKIGTSPHSYTLQTGSPPSFLVQSVSVESETINVPGRPGIYPGVQWDSVWTKTIKLIQGNFNLDLGFELTAEFSIDIQYSIDFLEFSVNETIDSITVLQDYNNLVYQPHLVNEVSKIILEDVCWFVNKMEKSEIIIPSREVFELVSTSFFTWWSLWDKNWQWGTPGSSSVTDIETRDEFAPVKLCNVFEFWSTGLSQFIQYTSISQEGAIYPNLELLKNASSWLLGVDTEQGHVMTKPKTFRHQDDIIIAEFLLHPERTIGDITEDKMSFLQLNIGSLINGKSFNIPKNIHSEQVLLIEASAKISHQT